MKRPLFFLMAFIGLSALGMLAWRQYEVNTDGAVMRLRGRVMTLPSRYLDKERHGGLGFWSMIPSLDSGDRELLLRIEAAEVSSELPGYLAKVGKYSDDLRLHVVLLSDEELKRYADTGRFLDIERGEHAYVNKVVENDARRSLVRVYRKIEYPNSWEVFKVRRDAPLATLPQDLPSNWVGHCIKSKSPLTESGELALCKSFVLFGHIAVHFTLSDENLECIELVKAFLLKRVASWQLTPDSGTRLN